MFFTVPGRWFFAVLAFLSTVFTPVLYGKDLYFEKRDFSTLTVPSVTSITQDDRGYIWFGTPEGLVRYDGRKLVLLNRKSHPEMPADQILSVEYVKGTDELWIGTLGGLVRYSLVDNKIRQVQIQHTGRHDASIEVIDIAVGAGTIFTVTTQGIYRLTRGDLMEEVPVDPAIEDDFIEIFDVAAGDDGTVWAAASDGLKQWDEEDERFRHTLNIFEARSIAVIGNEVWSGKVGNGILRFEPETGDVERYSSSKDTSIIIAGPDGLIWAGSSSGGLTIINPETGEVRLCDIDPEHPYKLPSARINSLLFGSSGHVWIGTADYGLYSVDIRKKNHLAYIQRSGSNGLPAGSIKVILEDSLGYIWTGSDYGGLARIDPLYGEIRQYAHDSGDFFSISGDNISDIVEDSTGRLWIGTDQGPSLYLPEVDGFEPAGIMMSGWPDFRGMQVLAIEEGPDGYIWMSFRTGELYKLDPQERDYTVFQFTSSSVPTVLMVDPQGTLWAGSRKNLRLFNRDGYLIKTWLPTGTENGGIQEGGVTSILSDSQGRVWLGSPAGISLYKGFNDGFEPLMVPDKRTVNVSGISEDREGNLWISDGRQVLIYNPGVGFVTTMGDDVGLTPTGFITSLTLGRNGIMYVGANGEIWNYNTYLDSLSFDEPKVFLTELSVMNETKAFEHGLDRLASLSLRSEEKVFSISFGAVDYRYQGEITYQYKLRNLDDEWVDLGETDSVTFANLSPGEYEFSVRALNELGHFSENKAVIDITVERSFWRKTPAIIMYIAAFFVIFVSFLKLWEGHLMKNQIRELEEARMKVLEANKQLSFLTMNDALTGLLNRRGFDQGISHALGTAQRNKLMITLFMMDVDFFKLYNDNYGHVQGDEVLRKVGKALRSVFERSTDIITRYGGEEFAVVFVGENPNASVTLANDLILAIEELMIPHEYSSVSKLLTLSTGSATFMAGVDETVEKLINHADQALYAAKAGGRNRICYTGILPGLPEKMKNGLKPLVMSEEIVK